MAETSRKLKKRSRGQPPHEPTPEIKQRVKSLTAYGLGQEAIAKMEGIDPKTLRKYYRHELDTAEDEANAKVTNTLFKMATSGQTPSATFFWLKTRAGFAETQKTVNENTNYNIEASWESD